MQNPHAADLEIGKSLNCDELEGGFMQWIS